MNLHDVLFNRIYIQGPDLERGHGVISNEALPILITAIAEKEFLQLFPS